MPANLAGPQGLNRISSGGTLVGLDLPPAGKNLELKPYAISRLTTDRIQTPPLRNDLAGDLGGDVKYGLTANLTADFTYNTDFAQVEIDEQQVNLTRFNLFFPEKREFFLEGAASSTSARRHRRRRVRPAWRGKQQPAVSVLQPPHRLNRGRVVPIDAGGRLTGKVGQYGVGMMNIQTGDEAASLTEPTNFSVVRVKRDILRRSSIGAMLTNRSTAAVDARVEPGLRRRRRTLLLRERRVRRLLRAHRHARGCEGDDDSYQGQFDYGGDRYGAHLEYLKVGDNFNPEVGFVARDDFRRSYATARFSPRPKAIKAVRKFTFQGNFDYFENGAGTLETRIETGRFNTEFENSDNFTLEVERDYELLQRPETILGVRHAGRRPRVHDDAGVVRLRRAAPGIGHGVAADRRLLQRHADVARLQRGAHLGAEAVLARADAVDQPRRDAGGDRHHAAVPHARRLRLHAADVRERAAAVQLRRPRLQQQPALPLGVSPGQRAVRRLHRRARHDRRQARRADAGARLEKPRVRRQDQPAAAILNKMQREDLMAGTRIHMAAIATLAGGLLALSAQPQGEQELVARARAIHERVITLDTHNDIDPQNFTRGCNYTMRLTNQVNLPKMKEGGLDVSFMIVYVGQSEPAAGRRRASNRPATTARTKPRPRSSTPSTI